MPDLIVTNFNRNFTGVSSTAASVVRCQVDQYDLALAGHPLPGCPAPITKAQAATLSRTPPPGRPFTIWHVRRNPEMRTALWVRDVLRRPIRIVFTSAAIRRHSAFPRWLISRMDAVIATTEAAAGFVPHVRAVAPHGVDTDRFTPAPDRAAAWAATGYPGTQGVATIGRIRPEKGTDRFVAAMLRLLPDHPGLTALVIGRAAKSDQPFLDNLKAQISAAGLTDRILFPGEVTPDALPALTRSLSAVVQLPRYEGYGMTPLEGMASGVPFVATDTGYYRSFSSQDETGLIVPDDPDQAADALASILSDPDRHATMSRAARDIACAHFSVTREAEAIARVYEELWSGA
ncbi:GDP-mannose-dependent alpha-(1-6)-phosphatidylinositol monomannoside mannosyltransferase [Roseovarius sp. THAF27]|uniref:glycosyltransferase family 4 protein n=1 Tax=Roseovarius sp. THAF27 TaxID=2587850 RepID=UPI001268E60F|nr:glycosyltransferase family 4 protein [Roseovarius sp. THAF27]QFT81421.1 GDP-mannose-dependent alpha-(1-6)-phosphatidylinositol monomannoside mannosyltransferase [Roseovarius sp. THAF27]